MTYAIQNSELKALNDFAASDPSALEKLAADPQAVLAEFGLDIDEATSAALAQNLEARRPEPGDRSGLEARKALDTSAQAAVVHIDL